MTNILVVKVTPQPLTMRMTIPEKPREERSYLDFIPDLKSSKPIEIRWFPEIQSEDEAVLPQIKEGADSILSSLSWMVGGMFKKINQLRQDSSLKSQSVSQKIEVVNSNPIQPILSGPVLFLKSSSEKIPKGSFEKLCGLALPDFMLPNRHFLRYSDPFEEELYNRVEYDMDEQDKSWLELVNGERIAYGLAAVSHDNFEFLVDRLEKEWFNLTKDIHRNQQEPLSHEESVCNICNDGECENTNAIVFCDGCNLAVHQECYGVPYIPEGQWLCRKCMLAPGANVGCIFCSSPGGALKQTTTNGWAHLLCALWIPEVHISNPVYMEPIEGIERIPNGRWKLVCSICRKRVGACIQCHKSNCFTAFHVTCARKAGFYMKIKHYEADGAEQTSHKAFCSKHRPVSLSAGASKMVDKSESEPEDTDTEWEAENSANENALLKERTSSLKKRNIFSSSTVVAPIQLLDRIDSSLGDERVMIKHRREFLTLLLKYWSIKRQFRRGAPLLKRLHLEPWTAFSSEIKQSEALKIARFKTLSHFRGELETIRILCDLVKRREREKLKKCQSQIDYLQIAIFPLNCILCRILDMIKRLDKNNFFTVPVRKEDVPDYYDVIKDPMDFNRIQQKISDFQYFQLEQFQADVELICSNATLYNKPGTVYARSAMKISNELPLLLENARNSMETFRDNSRTRITAFTSKSLDADRLFSLIDQSLTALQNDGKRRKPSTSRVAPLGISPGEDENLDKIIQKLQVEYEETKFDGGENDSAKIDVGVLVWAKLMGFPWFPAEITDKNQTDIPDTVQSEKGHDCFLARFFDRDLGQARSWVWVPPAKIQRLDFGVEDASMLELAMKKSPGMRKQVFVAYIVACRSRGVDPANAFSKVKLSR